MENLEYKYRRNKLSTAELHELRNKVNSMSDDEIGQEMYQTWMNEDIDEISISNEYMDKIKTRIENSIHKKNTGRRRFIHIVQIAASILLPVFIALSGYLYYENKQITTEEIIVTTGKGERASVTLPDGTNVSLNSESKLGYLPKVYNKEQRKINFNGEGYFHVCKNKEAPFIIDAKGLKIKVLGTKFNLLVHKNCKIAELALEEGSVWFEATKSNKNVVLLPNQKAILEQSTGNITVITDNNIKKASAWKYGNMIFRNTDLSEVIRAIEENYNVTIKITSKNCPIDSFTGTLPVTNLNEVLEVIEKSYHLKAQITGKEIILTDI